MHTTARRTLWTLLPLLLWLAPWAAGAQGVSYRYELHDATFTGAGNRGDATAPFTVHRIGFVDESGAFASGLMSFFGADYQGSRTDLSGKTFDTYAFQAHPVTPGVRVALEFAFEGPTDLDVEVDGQPVDEDTKFNYFELRLNLGASDTFGDIGYAVLDAVDFVARDVTGRAGRGTLRNDQYAFYSGLELGVLLPLSRVGGYVRYDWIRGLGRLISLGDEDMPAHTYDVGLAAAVGVDGLRLEARWGKYQWSGEAADGSGANRVEGTQLTLGGQASF